MVNPAVKRDAALTRIALLDVRHYIKGLSPWTTNLLSTQLKAVSAKSNGRAHSGRQATVPEVAAEFPLRLFGNISNSSKLHTIKPKFAALQIKG